VPTIPFIALEQILHYVPSMRDRKNFRLVCYNWLYTMDVYVGMDLKLKKENKAKLFGSYLLRSCSSVKICESAGLLNWYICYFSPQNLKTVEIQENILGDNWRLLLGSCTSIEFLTVTAHIMYFVREFKCTTCVEKSFIFPAKSAEPKINHPGLRRIVFKDIDGLELVDCNSIANMMNSIGIAPRLQQVVIIFEIVRFEFQPNDLIIKNALLSLMDRNPRIGSVGLVARNTSYQDMSMWDNLLKENKRCLVQSSGVYNEWQEVFQKLLKVDTLYYGTFREFHLTGFQTLLTNILNESPNLRKLFLIISMYRNVFDCRFLLEGLVNLEELSLCNYQFPERLPQYPLLVFLDGLPLSKLKYFYISAPLSEINMTSIFSIPLLEELHIKNQESAEIFKRRHFDQAVTHQNLKLIFWGKKFQQIWDKYIHHHELKENWDSKKQKQQKLQPQKFPSSPGYYVEPIDEGFLDVKEWRKKYAKNFVVFNKERMKVHDWKKIKD